MRRVQIWLILFSACLAFTTPALAVPIPLGTTTADDLIINFDFPSNADFCCGQPLPPYLEVHVDSMAIDRFASGPSGSISVDIFSGLNGQGLVSNFVIAWPSLASAPAFYTVSGGLDPPQIPGIFDGLFSYGFRTDLAGMDLNTISAEAGAPGTCPFPGADGNCFAVVSGIQFIAPFAVPEPGTLALFIAGLFGFGALRRHKTDVTVQ